MLEVKWDYLENNICSDDKPVAILRLSNFEHRAILYVYESRDHHYCTLSPEYNFLKPKIVTYNLEHQKVDEKHDEAFLESISAHDFLVLRLKEGCKIIEDDLLEQVEKILQLLS